MSVKTSAFARNIFDRTYAFREAETWTACVHRVISGIAPDMMKQLLTPMDTFKLVAGGRYLYSVGRREPQNSSCFLFRVGDSAKAWSEFKHDATIVTAKGGGSGAEYSEVRERGAPIKGYGGFAGGPVGLAMGLNDDLRYMKAGAARRGALWAGLNWDHPDVEEFARSKDWDPETVARKELSYNYPAPLDQTNISIGLDDLFFSTIASGLSPDLAEDYHGWVKRAMTSGDPGFAINVGTKRHENLRNPCQPESSPVLTPEGIRTLGEVGVGSVIWSGSRWTMIMNKVHTGRKRVFKYITSGGVFEGTKEHRVFEGGSRVQVQHAQQLDRCVGESGGVTHTPQHILDGLVIGDGMVKVTRAHKKIYLIIGAEDDGYVEELGDLIGTCWNDGKTHCVETTIQVSELAKTYDRVIPERFYKGDRHTVCGFLRGLFTANGSLLGSKRGSSRVRVTLHQTSEELIRQVQDMLSGVGIASYITTNGPHDIAHKNGVYTSKRSYILNITGDGMGRFYDTIGFIQERKQCTHKPRRTSRKVSFDINEVRDMGVKDVYDITVAADEHSYWTGGVLVSNCTEVTGDVNGISCNLGSLNFAQISSLSELEDMTRLMTRFLLMGTVNGWLPPDCFADFRGKRDQRRQIGVGFMGLGEWFLQRELPYAPCPELDQWLQVWQEVSDEEAKRTAEDLGIAQPAAVRAVAPTGTLAIMAGTTGGIEPLFAKAYKRTYDDHGVHKHQYVVDPVAQRALARGTRPEDIEDAYILSSDITRRLAVQARVQEFCDQGISSTINLPAFGSPGNDDVEKMGGILLDYMPKLRGITLYPDGSRGGQPLQTCSIEEAEHHNDTVYQSNPDTCRGDRCGI